MSSIVKEYLLPVEGKQVMEMPKNAWILSVAPQMRQGILGTEVIVLYVLVDPQNPTMEPRHILMTETDSTVLTDEDLELLVYIGSAFSRNGLVWHVFEEKEGHSEL